NPSKTMQDDGSYREEYLQIVGSRWTKAEDDGLFYACWSLFTHFRCTGDDTLMQSEVVPLLQRCVAAQLEKSWDEDLEFMGSDTLGEDLLAGNTYYGYDIVNGSVTASHHHNKEGKNIERCYSLYHQINTYNVLMIMIVAMKQRPDLDQSCIDHYQNIADKIQRTLREKFIIDGQLSSMFLRYDDGSEEWVPFGLGCDYWEHAWAVSQGPFFPVPDLQLASARLVMETWADYRAAYGYCPWNVLARSLSEYGLDSATYKTRLSDQIQEAEQCSQKYPMAGALTEYHGGVEGWRALPFSAGSLSTPALANYYNPRPRDWPCVVAAISPACKTFNIVYHASMSVAKVTVMG
ncbi:MAG: hypothetical protein HRU15_21085, partial [Planctomycetes bacterium]|nr:hypothetical protein [Planctomycetota bacterium]